jgi:hypothetical protein
MLRFLPAGNILDCRQPPLQLVAASRQQAEKQVSKTFPSLN